jgi:hypothetical protein
MAYLLVVKCALLLSVGQGVSGEKPDLRTQNVLSDSLREVVEDVVYVVVLF